MISEIEELNNLLKYADISQSELAKQFKVSKMAVSKWLSGKSIPTKAKLAQIQGFLTKFKGTIRKGSLKTLQKSSKLDKKMVIGRLIEFWQKHRNFDANIRNLSNYVGVTPRTLYKWLNRKSCPRPAKIRIIEEWLNKR